VIAGDGIGPEVIAEALKVTRATGVDLQSEEYDLGGAISGGIGRAASANLNPDRTGPSLFEPVHGSAPDIAGTGRANPIAAIVSAAMLLDFLGEADAASRMTKAVEAYDASAVPHASTSEIGDAIAERL